MERADWLLMEHRALTESLRSFLALFLAPQLFDVASVLIDGRTTPQSCAVVIICPALIKLPKVESLSGDSFPSAD